MFTNRKKFTHSLLAAAACAAALTFGAPGIAAARQAVDSSDASVTNSSAKTAPRFSFGAADSSEKTVIGTGNQKTVNAEPRFTFIAPTREARYDAPSDYTPTRNAWSGRAMPDHNTQDGARTGQRFKADSQRPY